MIKLGIVRPRLPFALICFSPFLLMGMDYPPLNKVDTIYFSASSIKDFKESEELIMNMMKTFPNHTELIWRLARNYFRIAKRTANEDKKMDLLMQCLKTAEKGISIHKNSAENIYFWGLCLGNISMEKGILNSLN